MLPRMTNDYSITIDAYHGNGCYDYSTVKPINAHAMNPPSPCFERVWHGRHEAITP